MGARSEFGWIAFDSYGFFAEHRPCDGADDTSGKYHRKKRRNFVDTTMDRAVSIIEGVIAEWMQPFDEHSGHAVGTEIAGENGAIIIVAHIATSVDRTTLDAEGVVVACVLEIEEHSGHPRRPLFAGEDLFIVDGDFVASSIDRKAPISERDVVERM